MTLLINEAEVRSLLTMRVAIDAVEESMRLQGEGKLTLQPRRRMFLPDKALLHYMAAGDVVHGYMGMKLYSSVCGTVRFLVPLIRSTTGEMAALIEADALGQIRTGAASGVATKILANAGAKSVGLIGTGYQARTQLEAVAAVRRLERVRVFGRDAERRTKFCDEMSPVIGVDVEPVDSAEKAIRDTEIIITATGGMSVVLPGEWLAPGMHVNAMGANFRQKRELDAAAVDRCDIVAVDSIEQAKMEAGDLIQAYGEQPGRWEKTVEFGAILAGTVPGRTSPSQVTLFKSIGIATWDLAVAIRIYEMAQQRGLGRQIPLWESSDNSDKK